MRAATVKAATTAVSTAAEASPAAGRICARDAAMIETAEGVGMNAGGCAARKSTGVTEAGMVVTRRSAIEMTVIARGSVVIDESRTVGDVGVVVVFHLAAVPVGSPVVPAPAKVAENPDAYA
jgi:hypothetical protein